MNILAELQSRFRRCPGRHGRRSGRASWPWSAPARIRSSATTRPTSPCRWASGWAGRRATWRPRSSRRLDVDDLCEPPEIAGPGFINLRLRDRLAGRAARSGRWPTSGWASSRPRSRGRIVVDYSAPERGQADARGPHPLDRDRRRALAHAAVPRPPRDRRQPHRRLGHAVRHDHLRLQAFSRSRGLSGQSGRGARPAVSAGQPAGRLSRRPRPRCPSMREQIARAASRSWPTQAAGQRPDKAADETGRQGAAPRRGESARSCRLAARRSKTSWPRSTATRTWRSLPASMPTIGRAVLAETAQLHAGRSRESAAVARVPAALPGRHRADLRAAGRDVRRHARREFLSRPAGRRGRRSAAARHRARERRGDVRLSAKARPRR